MSKSYYELIDNEWRRELGLPMTEEEDAAFGLDPIDPDRVKAAMASYRLRNNPPVDASELAAITKLVGEVVPEGNRLTSGCLSLPDRSGVLISVSPTGQQVYGKFAYLPEPGPKES